MPTYEYECQKCGKTFEIFQNISDKSLSVCSDKACSGEVRRLIGTGVGFIFKGPGFYATDYRTEGYKKREREENAGSPACKSCDTKDACKK